MLQRRRWRPGKPIPAISGLLLSCHFTLYTRRWQRACRAEGGLRPLLKNTHAHEMFYFRLGKSTICRTILKMRGYNPGQIHVIDLTVSAFQGLSRETDFLSTCVSLSSIIAGSGVDHGWEWLCARIPPVHLQRGQRPWDGDDSHIPAAGWGDDTLLHPSGKKKQTKAEF